jgi:hypothetical protein
MREEIALLAEAEVNARLGQLAALKSALSVLGVESVLARNHRLVLRYNVAPLEPSGLTDPQLHIFSADGARVATTDGAAFRLDQGGEFPAESAAAAAELIAAEVTLAGMSRAPEPLHSRSQRERGHRDG